MRGSQVSLRNNCFVSYKMCCKISYFLFLAYFHQCLPIFFQVHNFFLLFLLFLFLYFVCANKLHFLYSIYSRMGFERPPDASKDGFNFFQTKIYQVLCHLHISSLAISSLDFQQRFSSFLPPYLLELCVIIFLTRLNRVQQWIYSTIRLHLHQYCNIWRDINAKSFILDSAHQIDILWLRYQLNFPVKFHKTSQIKTEL